MRLKQKIYCNKEFVDCIISNRKQSRACMIAYKTMLLLGDLYIDLPKEEIRKLIQEKDFYKAIYQSSRGIHSAIGWYDYINFNDIADELFFIRPDLVKSYKVLRLSNGCLMVACDNDIEYLERMCRECNFSLIPTKERLIKNVSYKNSWREVLNSTKISPINAALINDNYIFDNLKFEKRKDHSLYEILRCLVPDDLKIPFHLTIFYCNEDALFTKEKADTIIGEIKDLKLCKDIKVTIVAHTTKDTTHDRKILTNYHYIESGKGFNNIDEIGIREMTSGSVSCIFQSIDTMHGDETKKHKYDYTQAWLKDIIENQIKNPACFIAGDNINRLLDK